MTSFAPHNASVYSQQYTTKHLRSLIITLVTINSVVAWFAVWHVHLDAHGSYDMQMATCDTDSLTHIQSVDTLRTINEIAFKTKLHQIIIDAFKDKALGAGDAWETRLGDTTCAHFANYWSILASRETFNLVQAFNLVNSSFKWRKNVLQEWAYETEIATIEVPAAERLARSFHARPSFVITSFIAPRGIYHEDSTNSIFLEQTICGFSFDIHVLNYSEIRIRDIRKSNWIFRRVTIQFEF